MARVRRRRLVPVYHHGSEIEAVTRAGSTCPFYDATDSLAPDEAEVESLLGGDAAVMSVTFFLILGPDVPGARPAPHPRRLALCGVSPQKVAR
jgi:hypothetical protein